MSARMLCEPLHHEMSQADAHRLWQGGAPIFSMRVVPSMVVTSTYLRTANG